MLLTPDNGLHIRLKKEKKIIKSVLSGVSLSSLASIHSDSSTGWVVLTLLQTVIISWEKMQKTVFVPQCS